MSDCSHASYYIDEIIDPTPIFPTIRSKVVAVRTFALVLWSAVAVATAAATSEPRRSVSAEAFGGRSSNVLRAANLPFFFATCQSNLETMHD